MRFARPEQTVTFTFDGRKIKGVPGEPVAAALMANGIKVMARSFKYHRPRGVMSAGSEEQNALVTIGPRRAKRTERPGDDFGGV